jgi:hypothetical protein
MKKPVKLSNPRTGEIWICENYENRRKVDGAEFVEVHRPENNRAVWMNIESLVKVKDAKLSKH